MSGISAIETTDTADVAGATRRDWLGLAVISLPCLLYAMDLTVLNLAIPQISAQLRPTSAQLLWIVDIYGLMVAGLLITMGTVGERIGRRRLLLIGASAFGAASVLAALATNTATLIVARALLGIAGATLAPSTLSLIRHMFRRSEERTFAIGVWTASFSIGAAIGPLVGGLVLQHFSWGAVFLIAVPIMLLLLAVGPMLLPEFRTSAAGQLDLISAVQSLAAVMLAILGFKQIAVNGWQCWAAGVMAAGVAVGISFVQRQRKLQQPLVDVHLVCSAAFAVPLAVYTTACFVMVGISLFTAQYLQLIQGLSPLEAGLWTLPGVAAFVFGSLWTTAVSRYVQPARLMSSGLMLAAIGLVVIGEMEPDSGIRDLIVGLVVLSSALATAIVPAINMMMSSVPPERAGEASAISETGSELGSTLGIAILGGVGVACYQSTLAQSMPPDLSEDQIRAASETLGGALAIAQNLPAENGMMLIAAARGAFDTSLRFTAILSAVIVAILAVAVKFIAQRRATHIVRQAQSSPTIAPIKKLSDETPIAPLRRRP